MNVCARKAHPIRVRIILLTLVTALVASGCFRMNLDIEVHDDGSGTVSGLIALDAEGISEAMGALGPEGGTDELCSDFEGEQGFGGGEFDEETPYNEDGYCGTRFSANFTPEEFDQAMLSDVSGGDATLERDGDGWVFEMPVDTEDISSEMGDADMFPGITELFTDLEYVIRVKLPGRQAEHNADYIDDEGFAVWEIDITNPPTEPLRLRTEGGDPIVGDRAAPASGDSNGEGDGNVLIIVLVVLALIALGFAAWYLMRKKGDGPTKPLPPVGADDQSASATPAPLSPPQTSAPPAAQNVAELSGVSTADAGAATPVSSPPTASSPTREEATGSPVWDPVRGAYVQWQPEHGRWVHYDDTSQEWVPDT